MSSVHTSQLMGQQFVLGSRKYYYNFRSVGKTFSSVQCNKVGESLLSRYACLTNQWTPKLNSEWVARVFFSAKMILSATVAVASLNYSEKQNLRFAQSYLRYYSVFSVLKAIVWIIPEVEWESGSLFRISHTKAINLAADHISQFDKAFAESLKERLLILKAQRELISYRAPTMGDHYAVSDENIADLCRLLAEIAQFGSELLEVSVKKRSSPSSWVILEKCIDSVATVEIEGFEFNDAEDAHRVYYLARKHPRMTNIMHSMTEGHTEDFFSAWRAGTNESGVFDPDGYTQIIFDIP